MTCDEPFTSGVAETAQFDYLVQRLTKRLSKYINNSSEPGSLGTKHDPRKLYRELVGSHLIETPEHGYGTGKSANMDKIFQQIDLILDKSINTWSLGFLDKLYASTNPIGVISDMVLSVLNTNSHVFTVSPMLTIIEKKIGKEYAKLFYGQDSEKCGGLTFAGGSWSNVTSMHMAKAYLYPETKFHGNRSFKFAIFTSIHSHYSLTKSAILCGFGSSSVFKISVNERGEMSPEDLEKQILAAKAQGFTPFYVNATAGTTVFGSFDPILEISKVTEKHNVWLHVDGSWGGNFIFSDSLKYKLKGIEKANSITSNPHKQLGVPTTCSFLLLKNRNIFQDANSLNAPYLFHRSINDADSESTLGDDLGNFDLADGTLGCGRRADALKFYLSWYFYGKVGFQRRVEYVFDIANYFAHKVSQHNGFELLNGFEDTLSQQLQVPCLQVCFYYNPFLASGLEGDEKSNISDYSSVTRFISHKLHKRGKYLIDYSPYPDATNPRAKGEFFRIVFINPKLSAEFIDTLVQDIEAVGKEYVSNT